MCTWFLAFPLHFWLICPPISPWYSERSHKVFRLNGLIISPVVLHGPPILLDLNTLVNHLTVKILCPLGVSWILSPNIHIHFFFRTTTFNVGTKLSHPPLPFGTVLNPWYFSPPPCSTHFNCAGPGNHISRFSGLILLVNLTSNFSSLRFPAYWMYKNISSSKFHPR